MRKTSSFSSVDQTSQSAPSTSHVQKETFPYRCGILIPSSNTTVEREAFRLMNSLGDLINFHFSRLYLESVTEEALLAMKQDLTNELTKLASANMNCYLYACTSGSFLKGIEYAKSISNEIFQQTQRPAITTAEAIVRAIKTATSSKKPRIALITPYVEKITSVEKAFLEHQGIHVELHASMGYTDNLKIGNITLPELVNYIQSVLDESSINRSDIDLVFVSCTNLQTLPIGFLEQNLGVSVVSSNSASFFAILKTLSKHGLNKTGVMKQKLIHLLGMDLL